MSLVATASLMPVEEYLQLHGLQPLSLVLCSAVFDNIPLTKLCLEQGGYDWGVLAYAVGFGGSIHFGLAHLLVWRFQICILKQKYDQLH